ncbi:double-strand break repair protein AddB [Xanthobacter pseudotagetidis]|uniref:double-strand break repair protein AddB n=1 Tax=Xanthobacter pseudotagetidis TaxID=3119911 RepID=UPI00372A1E46
MARVLTLPPSADFLPALAHGLMDGAVVDGFAPRGDPLALARATVFLPTRRACRAFADALLAASGREALLLPRIVPLGDVDEDALAFSEDAPLLAAPHAMSPTARRIALAALVARWRAALAAGAGQAAVAAGPAATFALADALAHLFDDLTTAGIAPERLKALVPREHDPYFELSLDFLRIARAGLSAHLAEKGMVEPAQRRDALVDAEAGRLQALGADAGPVIAAGSTGSLPATARLLKAISRLPRGAVVLPGLDRMAEDAAFACLARAGDGAPDHPQYGLARLLGFLEIGRADVIPLAAPARPARELLASEALRQAETSDAWARLDARLPPAARAEAMAGVSVVEAQDPREEALAIALLLRDALERPGETAALVTPDRDLARRVAAELERFGVVVDDSAGTPLGETALGRLARLVADAAAADLAPVPLFALLSHPRATLGLDPDAKAEALSALELAVLRGPRPSPGAAGLIAALDAFDQGTLHPRDPRRRVGAARLAPAKDLARRLADALAPLLARAGREPQPFADLVAAHRAAVEAVAGPLNPDADDPAETALAAAFVEIADGAADGPDLTLADYADAAVTLLGDTMVRPLARGPERLRILGPLEARLLAFDRMILGGLVEGTWPALPETDPWLSRPMRAELGLDLPERRIGLSAHDFVQGFAAKDVVLTYAAKVAGAQSVPSRFVQRLRTVAGAALWEEALARGARWRVAAAALDVAPPVPRLSRPAPAPPLALRPRRLTVTEIETLLRDPYSIYARHVLGLAPLDPLDAAPGGAERGSALHEAVGNFARDFPRELPPDALARLLDHGRAAFRPLEAFGAEHALWWARFERAAAFLVALERERRPALDRVVAETSGALTLDLPAGPFELAARADRIELRADGRADILDFKTGTAPTARQAASLSPQLPLEAAMVRKGAFRDVPAAEVGELAYVELKGGAAGGEVKPVTGRKGAAELADDALAGLTGLLAAFDDPAQGYRSLAAPQWRGRFGDYDHLARVREWALGGEEDE